MLFEADAHGPFQRHLETEWPVALRYHGSILHSLSKQPLGRKYHNKKAKVDPVLDWETDENCLTAT